VQEKVGATFCDPCPEGFITTSGSGLGFTGRSPWQCVDGETLSFIIEGPNVISQQLSITVTWRLPKEQTDVKYLVALFKEDGWTSLRQLQWVYASAIATLDDTDSTLCKWASDDNCRQPGQITTPWASVTFMVDMAGAGNYSSVYFSTLKGIRMLTVSWLCDSEKCNIDNGGWETDTGLFVCKPGQFSSTGGTGPCTPCPPGTFSSEFASTKCDACPKAFYSGFANGDLGAIGSRIDSESGSPAQEKGSTRRALLTSQTRLLLV